MSRASSYYSYPRVTLRLGFSSLAYFCNVYRQFWGQTPRDCNPAQTIGNFNQSPTVLQPPHQPSFNRLPTTTHTLLARASSHLPRQGRSSPSLPRRADLRHPHPIHPLLTSSSPALLTLLTLSPAPQPSASDQGWTLPVFSDLKTNLSSTRITPIILSAMRPANGTTSLCGFCQDLI